LHALFALFDPIFDFAKYLVQMPSQLRNLFFFSQIIKTLDVKFSKEWVSGALRIVLFLNRQRKGDCQGPMETKVKQVSNLLPAYSFCDRMLGCRICIMKNEMLQQLLINNLKFGFALG